MSFSEKKERLKKTSETLKEEFVGLDSIIDKIIESISPWYMTPEILERPIVVSLWGLTGTGKTSLIKRMINLLGLTGKSLSFDCGEQTNSEDKSFSSKLSQLFECSGSINESDLKYRFSDEEISAFDLEQESSSHTEEINNSIDYLFVLDEFQYLKTKDESNCEIDRPESRAIWNLIDSGIIDLNVKSYLITKLQEYISDLELLNKSFPGIKILNGKFYKTLSLNLKSTVSYFKWFDKEDEEDEDEISDGDTDTREQLGFPLLSTSDCSDVVQKLNQIKKGLGITFLETIKTFTTLSSYLEYLSKYLKLISKPRVINCSKSLIFVIGNLDEAFKLTDEDMDPDVDADVYHEITSDVNIMDIKLALKRRFRDEQVGRLGNNMIIYPSPKRCDFEKIIDKELARIGDKFLKISNGIKLEFSSRMKEFIYQEGVFPIQGIRPIFTTINSIITPRLSEILMDKEENANKVIFDVVSDKLDIEEVEISITQYEDEKVLSSFIKKQKTVLGTLRNRSKCEKLAIQGIHEASHAVLYSKLTGEFPSAIIAGSLSGGGYVKLEFSNDNSVINIEEFENDVKITLAGYVGERYFFEEKKCTLGSSSDFSKVWFSVADAFSRCGYKDFYTYSYGTNTPNLDFIPKGLEWSNIEPSIKSFINKMYIQTKELIGSEEKLILEISKYLSNNRGMDTNTFKEFIAKYAKTFSLKGMEELRENNKNYYKKTIYEWED